MDRRLERKVISSSDGKLLENPHVIKWTKFTNVTLSSFYLTERRYIAMKEENLLYPKSTPTEFVLKYFVGVRFKIKSHFFIFKSESFLCVNKMSLSAFSKTAIPVVFYSSICR